MNAFLGFDENNKLIESRKNVKVLFYFQTVIVLNFIIPHQYFCISKPNSNIVMSDIKTRFSLVFLFICQF